LLKFFSILLIKFLFKTFFQLLFGPKLKNFIDEFDASSKPSISSVFFNFSHREELNNIALSIGISSPKLLQSMYIFKQPQIGGEVVCHQDSTFLYTKPESAVGFWVALEDATIENGCL